MSQTQKMLDDAKNVLVVKIPKTSYDARPAERQFDVYTTDAKTKLVSATEQFDCCCRSCLCCYRRAFDLSMSDADGTNAYKIQKSSICCPMCPICKFCQHRLILLKPSHRVGDSEIGYAMSERHVCGGFPNFVVWDANAQEKFRLQRETGCCGRCCPWCFGPRCGCRGPSEYHILEKGTRVGGIRRIKHPKFERFKSYNIAFPPSASSDMRALVLASSFLMNYTMMDEGPNEEQMEREEVGLPPKEKDITPEEIDGLAKKPEEDE